MFGWLRKLFGTRKAVTRQATYDSARTTDDNKNHWAHADALSARTANTLETRKTLRERARYESANNSYCRGMILTRSNDLVGTGPRLQILGDDREANRRIEKAWCEWSEAVGLPEKLRTASQAYDVDGEAFAVMTRARDLPTAVQLDVQLVECDRVTDPYASPYDLSRIDGITYDSSGRPVSYDVLKEHPGDFYRWGIAHVTYPARYVLHWFRADRPGQGRGVPTITPALPLFAQLRRYTSATVKAAEIGASFAAVVEQPAMGDESGTDEVTAIQPGDTFEFEHGMATALPPGGKLSSFKPEQPTTNYKVFKHELLGEIARCLDMPFNKAAGNSSSYNYASGRLDHQTYFRSLKVDRSRLERVWLDRVFAEWLEEAVMVPGLLPAGTDVANLDWRWMWDGWEHVDPVKEATADDVRLLNHTLTYADYYAQQGQDWEDAFRQRAKELELMEELGLPVPSRSPAQAAAQPADQADQADQMDPEEVASGD